MKILILTLSIFLIHTSFAQKIQTPFEKSNNTQTTTYKECIQWYKLLAATNGNIKVVTRDTTDAGYPLHTIIFSYDKTFDADLWHTQNKVVILVNNGIHPGEPDGIDASMMLLRDLADGTLIIPQNVVLAVIPIYNIGGSLNRNSFTRVNQNGPESYGFRGNAQNLDLNRDFIKADSKNARAFTRIFHWLKPDILVDNHVSDGADYQHTMTLLSTQHNKLGGPVGEFMHNVFEPALFKSMLQKNWPMCPYVNFEEGNLEKGWDAFNDAPRYSTGYAALFQTICFMPETHMLKPFADRVKSTYAFMQTVAEQSGALAEDLLAARRASAEAVKQQQRFALSWQVDTVHYELVNFKGYAADSAVSQVTGMNRLFYNHRKPFEKQVKFYNTFLPGQVVTKPKAYIIPHGWQDVVERLQLNGVRLQQLQNDTALTVEVYHIKDYKSLPRPYEKHHRNYNIHLETTLETIHFLAGDYITYTGHETDRYVVETLEPLADDSFFSWNFFDAVLQQKEGYSDYRWEDIAAQYLQQHPEVKEQLQARKKADSTFAASASEQLRFVYTHSPWYEPAHNRYPVYRLVN
ncbi:M14 family metallopeptidase [Foetidibacter luteolus]|uniref:M14 family metallopeptidase n=1 Tax=Foetidibacter luteolus TaxID=2608880 RepID=UPI00129B2F60|nr:M14 family metallopeptidase [Foetidibacter luteolus]